MSEFSTSTQKLRKIFERVNANTNNLNLKADIIQNDFLLNNLFKNPILLFDSGLLPFTPTLDNDVQSISKSTILPTKVSFKQDIDLEIPEDFLPFIRFVVESNPPSNKSIKTIFKFESTEFDGDFIEISGDGTTIYKGPPPPDGGSFAPLTVTFTEEFLDGIGVPSSHSKNAFQGTITKTDDSIVVGMVVNIDTLTNNGTGCESNENTTSFVVDHLVEGTHEFLSLNSTSFTAIGRETISTWTFVGPTCTQNIVVNEDVQRTINFASTASYSITLNGTVIFDTQIKDPKSSNQSFVFFQKWLFWSSNREKRVDVFDTGNTDGTFKEFALRNLPNSTQPYTAITFLRNPDPHPEEVDTTELVKFTSREFKNYFRLTKSTATSPKFRFQLNGEFLVLSDSPEQDPNTKIFPEYNDLYTVVSSQYEETTRNHSFVQKFTNVPKTEDIEIRFKAFLVNPFYWQENRSYKDNGV